MNRAREAALDAAALLRRGSFSTEALETATAVAQLDRRDAALCARIVLSTVQNLGYIDYVLSLYSKTRLQKLEATVLDILRISAAQLL